MIKFIKYELLSLLIVSLFSLNYLFAQLNYPLSTQVNSTAIGHQDSPEIAVNSFGTVLSVFESTVSGDDDENVFAVSYDRKTFKEFYHSGQKADTPSLEAFPNSDKFVVAWEQSTQMFFAIVSCKDGVEEFIVEPKPVRDDYALKGKRPDVAISSDGSLIAIAWQLYFEDEVVYHFFDSLGTPIRTMNKISSVSKRRSQIGLKFRPDSVLVATWHTKEQQGSLDDIDIWFQLIDCKDVFTGGDPVKLFETAQRANGDLSLDYANYKQEYPEIDVFDDGRFAIMWQDFPYSNGGNGTDGNSKGAYFRIFNKDGTTQTDDIQIADHTLSFQKDADMRIRQSDKTIHFIYEDAYESTIEKDWLAYPMYRVFDDSGAPTGSSLELSDKSYGTDCRIAITDSDAETPNLVLWIWETKDIEDYDGSGRAIVFRDSSSILSSLESFANSNIKPKQIELMQNYPNPFNASTIIKYNLNTDDYHTISIYNSLGEEVTQLVNEYNVSGSYQFTWDANNVSSGVYYISLKTSTQHVTKKCLLLK